MHLANSIFPISDLDFPELQQWYSKAYTKVTEITERPLLCEHLYFTIYLTWVNFAVKFVVPTVVLIGCNIKILYEVSVIYKNSYTIL